jgi:hypothetical protein
MLALRQAIRAESSRTTQKANALEFDAAHLIDAKETIIQYASAKVVVQARSSKLLIMEPVDESFGISPQSIIDAEILAWKLQHIDPDTFGILRCEGILMHTDQSRRVTALDVVFRAPSTTQTPTTLRQLLLNQQKVSLSAIVDLAKQLVRSVSYIHTWYVHGTMLHLIVT